MSNLEVWEQVTLHYEAALKELDQMDGVLAALGAETLRQALDYYIGKLDTVVAFSLPPETLVGAIARAARQTFPESR
jgi:hypothetical protein